MIHIAIIGSGPSGCYVADTLAKKIPDSQVTIFDKLPTPFGLVRAGVAPDHLHTKNICRQFERILSRENIRFAGNVDIGEDISYAELKQHYHIVVIACGAPFDRSLDIQGEALNGVYGSGEISRWYNGHPDEADLNPRLSETIAIIGHGNVALDIARILSKHPEQLSDSDISQQALERIGAANITDIYLIGRRGPADTSFTPAELQEVLALDAIEATIDSAQIPTDLPAHIESEQHRNTEKNLTLFRSINNSKAQNEGEKTRIHFIFCASPISINGDNGHVATLHLLKNRLDGAKAFATDEQLTFNAGTVISAIGFRAPHIANIPYNHQKGTLAHHEGKVESGVYAVGWCKNGPNGVIPTNRVDAINTAKTIIAEWEHTVSSPKKEGFDSISILLANRNIRIVSYNDWQLIDQAEINRAASNKPREKLTKVTDMLALL